MNIQMLRKAALLSFLLFVGLLVACTSRETPPPPRPKPVRVSTVKLEHTVFSARYSGEVKARHEPNLAFRVDGKLIKRMVDVGAVVHKGDLLATLDAPDFKLKQAGSEAQLKAAEAELARVRKDLTHIENLARQNFASPAHIDRRQDALDSALAQVAEAKSALGLSKRQTGFVELRAEQDGVISAVEAEAGQVVSAGQTVFRLSRTDEMEVVVSIPENRLDDLRSATTIKVSLWAKPEVFYQAKLREISPGVDAQVRTFTVKVSVPQADENMRMGMTATVHVQRQVPQPVAFLPLTAVTEWQGKPAVWVYDPALKKVRPRQISLAEFGSEQAKIVGGLNDGEKVVTAGVHKLVPEMSVRLLEEGL